MQCEWGVGARRPSQDCDAFTERPTSAMIGLLAPPGVSSNFDAAMLKSQSRVNSSCQVCRKRKCAFERTTKLRTSNTSAHWTCICFPFEAGSSRPQALASCPNCLSVRSLNSPEDPTTLYPHRQISSTEAPRSGLWRLQLSLDNVQNLGIDIYQSL